jgi:hypothetical protein
VYTHKYCDWMNDIATPNVLYLQLAIQEVSVVSAHTTIEDINS